MGFRPEPTIYNLNFQGTHLEGLHVKMSACTVGEYSYMLKLGAAAGDDLVESNEKMLDLFLGHLKSWDLEDDKGKKVPTTMEGIIGQERGVIAQIIQAWQIAIITVPPLSPVALLNGGISQEQSLDLGGSSQSLPS